MKKLIPLMVVVCLGMTHSMQAQTDVNRDIDVAKVYEEVVKEGYGTPTIYLKLANEHYYRNNFRSAKKWFEKVFQYEKISDKETLFRYKQTLKALDMKFEGNPYIAVAIIN